jgi:hypothetical protein
MTGYPGERCSNSFFANKATDGSAPRGRYGEGEAGGPDDQPAHVGVTQPGGQLGFPGGTAAGCLLLRRSEVRRPGQLLHRHVAAEELVAGLPYDTHAGNRH